MKSNTVKNRRKRNKLFFDPKMYLADLTSRLLAGAAEIDECRKAKLRHFFLAAQTANGGFAGRQGNGDPYYTAFALRGLFLLSALDTPPLLESVSAFLKHKEKQKYSPVELASLIQCLSLIHLVQGTEFSIKNRNGIIAEWKSFKRPDGCFASSERTEYSSTYTTFLAAMSFEMLGAEDEKQLIPVEPILARQRSDGGFVELDKLRQSGTNPTAAAIAFLKIQGCKPKNKQAAADFLLARQMSNGAFQANTLIPVTDLLSTFTAIVALIDLQAECRFGLLPNFLTEIQTPDGGYSGGAWDCQSDVEYTFYGLALEALVQKS